MLQYITSSQLSTNTDKAVSTGKQLTWTYLEFTKLKQG